MVQQEKEQRENDHKREKGREDCCVYVLLKWQPRELITMTPLQVDLTEIPEGSLDGLKALKG